VDEVVSDSVMQNFKSMHYEFMREWLHKQELVGNIIKFSQIDSKYCVGF